MMIELGLLSIRNAEACLEARKKIRALLEDLGFDALHATRLETIFSEISRLRTNNNRGVNVTVGLDSRENHLGVSMTFSCSTPSVQVPGAGSFFDIFEVAPSDDGTVKIETFRYLPEYSFIPSEEFIATQRQNLALPSRAELLNDLKEKNAQLEEINAAITNLMRTDSLTGLANRRYFLEVLENIMPLARRHHTPLSLIMADLDHFKTINDTYGHAGGDQVLKDFGGLLKKQLRREDLSARFGGEEFIMALPLTDLLGARSCAEKIRLGLEGMEWDQIKCKVTGSFGISQFYPDDTPESFIERADKALYQAKQEGRNRVVVAEGGV